jgi:hypothetical protein
MTKLCKTFACIIFCVYIATIFYELPKEDKILFSISEKKVMYDSFARKLSERTLLLYSAFVFVRVAKSPDLTRRLLVFKLFS